MTIRSLTPEKASALLAIYNRDPAKFIEVTKDSNDSLYAELNLQDLLNVPQNVAMLGKILYTYATPIPDGLSPTEQDYFQRGLMNGRTPEQALADLDTPKMQEFIRQRDNLLDLAKEFGSIDQIPAELRLLVLKGVQVTLKDGEGDWKTRLELGSFCSEGDGACDSQKVKDALNKVAQNMSKYNIDAINKINDPKFVAKALSGESQSDLIELKNALEIIKICNEAVQIADAQAKATATTCIDGFCTTDPEKYQKALLESKAYQSLMSEGGFQLIENNMKLFNYLYGVTDGNIISVSNQLKGGGRAVLGVAGVAGSAAVCYFSGGAVCAASVPSGAMSFDEAIAGLRQAYSGKSTQTAVDGITEYACAGASNPSDCEATVAKMVLAYEIGSGVVSIGAGIKGSARWAKLEGGLEGTTADISASGRITSSNMIKAGTEFNDFTVTEQQLVARIQSIGDKGGDLTEQLITSYAKRNGYDIVEGAKYGSNNGFDIVLKKGEEIIIVEAKQMNGGAVQLSNGTITNPPQMSEAWVKAVIDKLPDGDTKKLLFAAEKNNNISTVVGAVDKTTGNLILAPIKRQ